MDPDELYGLPLDEFIARRGALAKSLRADKRRDEATEVAGLRKPSVAAWAVNQLVRTQHAHVQALFDAGDELREAQAKLLRGSGDGRTLRAAGDHERAAVERLVEAARGLLTSRGDDLSLAVVERVSDTLHAAALDEDARALVRAGRLERELRHVGLGFGGDPVPTTRPATGRSTAPRLGDGRGRGAAGRTADAKESAAERDEADRASEREQGMRTNEREQASRAKEREQVTRAKEREEAESARRDRAAARTAARAVLASAQRRADRAASEVRAAESRREDAALALRDAEAACATASEAAEVAADILARARAALDEAQARPSAEGSA